jgi:outer membrane protein OmpA-like peptidoglycan-associated protein
MKSHLILSACLALAITYPALAQDATQNSTAAATNAQTQSPDQTRVEPMDKTPLYHVTVVGRTAKAVSFQHRSGDTKLDFRGTTLAPKANGTATVNSKQGRIQVTADLRGLDKNPQTTYGPEYLTYVLWAITPDGRPENLGEILVNDDGNSKETLTTGLQAFALIVTAEPYFAVTQPSDVVVMENQPRYETKGKEEDVNVKYNVIQRDNYLSDVNKANIQPLFTGERTIPLELLEARNAIRIAGWAQANNYASDTYAKAQQLLNQAQAYQDRNAGKKPVIMTAREAVQTAEDARVMALRRREQERVTAERKALQDREAAARAQAEQQQQLAQQAQQNAQLAQQNAQLEAQQRQQAEQERLAADQARQQAEAATQQAQQERQQADAARQAAIQQQQQLAAQTQQAQQQAQQAQQQAQQAQQEREQLRARLRDQLNQVLQTRDTARGLIVNMSDVLFDTGKATLRVGAREKLAKVAGILLAYPDLRLSLGGHTDSTGSLSFNQQLSQQRAAAVRDYLISQGLKPTEIVAVDGFGPSQPVASNATPAGRQQNRRVEIVVAGDAIGNNVAPAATNGAVSAQQ